MSQTRVHIGNARLVPIPVNKTANEFLTNLLKELGQDYDDSFNNVGNQLNCEFSDKYFYHEKSKQLFKLNDKELDTETDIIEANMNNDGSISYTLQFYDGGTWFGECIEEAFDKLFDKL